MRHLPLISTLLISGFIAACSSGTTSLSSSQVSTALSLAKTKVGNAVQNTSSISASSVGSMGTITGLWTNASYAIGGDFGNSPRNSIRVHGDKTAQSSLMYRFNQNMTNICVFTSALPSSDGALTLTAGSTITLTAALKATLTSSCTADLSGMPDDTVVGYKVEDISAVSGSQYDRKVSFDVDGNGTYTQYTDTFLYRASGTLTRFYFYQDGTNESVAFFEYDSASGIAKFEFTENAPGSPFKLHYRVILDEANDAGYFTAYVANATDSMKAVVGSYEGGGTELAVSYTFVDDGANDVTDGNACVYTSDFTIALDNSLSCTNVTGAAASTYTVDHAFIDAPYFAGLDATSVIQFTSSATMRTATQAN